MNQEDHGRLNMCDDHGPHGQVCLPGECHFGGHTSKTQFFSGPSSEANWKELLEFLRFRYGRMRRQQPQSAIDRIRRDGRTPANLLALVGQAAMDEVIKEQLVRQVPTTIGHARANVDDMSATEVATAADAYFDHEGHKLNTSPSSLNSVGNGRQRVGSDSAHP